MSERLRPGEIVLEHASRSFDIRADRGRTLKELVLRRDRGVGPAPVQALRDVTLRVSPGETVGVVGRNGAGKSSTLLALAGIIPLHSGRAECGGRVVSLLELGAGFSRDFSGRENIYLNGALHGLSRQQIDARMDAIVAFAELGDFIDVPVRTYSAGMFLRLGFAIAAHLDADVLLIDEVLAVGDEAFQRRCLRRIADRIAEGATVVLVSHDTGAIERVCERVVVLDAGGIIYDGPVAEGLLFYHRLMGTEHESGRSVRPAGARPVEVDDVELQDAGGRRCRVFRTGDQLRIALGLRAREALTAARVELEVRDEHGRAVFRTATDVATPAATARLAFEVPRLALLGGDYDLAVSASAREADAGEGVDRLVGFSVAHEPGAEGVADLRGAWRVEERARVAS